MTVRRLTARRRLRPLRYNRRTPSSHPRREPEHGTADAPIPAVAPATSSADDRTERVGPLLYLYLTAVLLPVWFYAGPLYLSLLRLMLLIVTVPLLLNLLRGAYGRVIPTDILFILHILWATIALAVNNPDQVVQQAGSVGLEFLGGYAVGRACIRSTAAFLTLCRVLLFTVVALLPFTLYETITGAPLIIRWIQAIPGINSVVPNYADPRLGLERVQSVFAHPIHFGLYCSVALSLVFVGLRNTLSDTSRWLGSGLVVISGFLALSSGALLAMILQVFLFSWSVLFQSVRQRWWLLSTLIFACFIIVEFLSDRPAIRVFLSYATFSAHTGYWRLLIFEWGIANIFGSAEKAIVGSPIFGIGMNDWVRPHYMYSGTVDNFWLVIAMRYGFPGFVSLATGYCWLLWKIMQRDIAGNTTLAQIRLAWVFTFVGLTFTLCTVHVWTSVYSFAFFVFGAGAWLLDAGRVQSQPKMAIAP